MECPNKSLRCGRILISLLVSAGLLVPFVISPVGWAGQKVVIASGVGFVAGGDLAAARDGAIRDAQLRALEQAVGIDLDARTVLHKELLIDDTVLVRTRGAVRSYKVLDETEDKNGLYRVRIEARVDPGAMQPELLHVTRNKKALLVRTSINGPGFPGDLLLARLLSDTFIRAGFHLDQVEVSEAEVSHFDEEKVRCIARRTGCEIVVVLELRDTQAQCMTHNLCAAGAFGSVKVFSGNSGGLLAAVDVEGVRGFGNNAEQAANDARRRAAGLLLEDLLGRLGRPKESVLQVAVLRLSEYEVYKNLQSSLGALRWVSAVEEDAVGFHPQKSIFLVRFRQDPDLFAAMLSKMGRYRFMGRSGSVYTLEFKGGA